MDRGRRSYMRCWIASRSQVKCYWWAKFCFNGTDISHRRLLPGYNSFSLLVSSPNLAEEPPTMQPTSNSAARSLPTTAAAARYALPSLLRRAAALRDLRGGAALHAAAIKTDLLRDPFIATSAITLYSQCLLLPDAARLFDESPRTHAPPWNALLKALPPLQTRQIYREMKRQGVPATSSTFSTLLAACPRGASSAAIHADVAKLGLDAGPFVSTSLVSVYSRLGDVAGAARAFAGAAEKRTELCNAIAGSIAACSLDSGRAIHGLCFKVGSSIAVWTALVAFYARRGAAADSAAVFESVGEKDLPLWGSMIAAQCHVGELRSAVAVLTRMVNAGLTPDSATLAVIAAATARSDRQELGFQVHGYAVKLGLERDTFVGSAMVDFYAKLDLLESAEAAFAAVDEKNLVAWNSILMAYGRSGDVLRCAAAIAEMRAVGLPPDSISITGALIAAVRSAGLLAGKTIHAFQMRNHVICDSRLGNTLIEMYVRCGCLAYARHVFDCLPERTLASWNSMISGYGSHGHCEKAIEVFEEMIRGSDQAPPPDEITFLALISACGHRGWTERGIEIFNLMIHGYKIKPSSKHCAAVADLLGRAGLLDEAFRFAKDLQIPEGDSVWKSLICSSRLHGDVIAGEAAAGQISRFSAEDHVQMWKLYDEAGMPDMAVVEKRKIKAQKLKKTPGCSWIEVRGSVEVFFSGGSYSSSSPLGDVTRELIFSLNRVLKDERIYT